MGFVRGLVDSGLSAAEASGYVEKARAMVKPEQLESVEQLYAKAMPLVDTVVERVDARVERTLTQVNELYDQAKEQRDVRVQLAKEKVQAAKDAKVKLQESTEATILYAKEQLAKDAKAKLQESTEATIQYAKNAKSQAQKTTEEKLEKVQQTLTSAKTELEGEYRAKKELVQRVQQDAVAKYSAGKEAVRSQLEQTTAEVQAVLSEGSVTQVGLVKSALALLQGTRCEAPAQRLLETADLLMPKLRSVLPAVPRTLEEMRAAATAATPEPLKEKLEAAKLRAATLAGRVSGQVELIRESATSLSARAYQEITKTAGPVYERAKAAGCNAYQEITEKAGPVYERAKAAGNKSYEVVLDAASRGRDQICETKTKLDAEVQAAVKRQSVPVAQALSGVFGREAVAAGYAKTLPLLPAAVADWIAQVEGLD